MSRVTSIEIVAGITILVIAAVIVASAKFSTNLNDCSELYLIDSRESLSTPYKGHVYSTTHYVYECDGRVVESTQDPNTLNVKVKP